MGAKDLENVKGIADAVVKRVTSKPKKVAKTFSVSAENYTRLEEWCAKQSKNEKESIKPSNVVDELISVFLSQTK